MLTVREAWLTAQTSAVPHLHIQLMAACNAPRLCRHYMSTLKVISIMYFSFDLEKGNVARVLLLISSMRGSLYVNENKGLFKASLVTSFPWDRVTASCP